MAKNLADLTGARTTKHSNGNGHGKAKGLRFNRFFTPPGSHAYDLVEWERRTASITGEKGQVIFEQKDVEVPRSWSQLAINVVAQKYFRGSPGSPERETSVRQIIDRVVDTIANWGRQGSYFATEDDAANWAEELRFLLVTQHASFNSPVWFNIGIPSRSQQASACFINSVQDSMESILDLAKTEGMLFKFGSGTGTNLSVLRSSKEQLSGGGTASGPVSFMKGYDSFAGSIKSGGTTRRAAKMVILNADHPDVVDFIHSKAEEEKKAWALIEAGYNAGFNVPGGAYDSVQFQNANHSVRVTDDFMRAVIDDKEWKTKAVVGGRTVDTYKARDLWREIADAAWICGDHHDPGLERGAQHGPDQRHQPVLGVRFPRRHGMQPPVFEPDEVPDRAGDVRRGALAARRRRLLHGPGDPRLQRLLPDPGDRQKLGSAPAARARLRQHRRIADVDGPGLRLGRRPAFRGRDHRDHDRTRVRPVGADGAGQGSFQ